MDQAGKVAWGVAGAAALVGLVVLVWPKKAAAVSAPAARPPLPGGGSQHFVITNLDHGKTFAVHPGDTITFQLAGLSTHGDVWSLSGAGPVFVLEAGPVTDTANQQYLFQGHVAGTGQASIVLNDNKPASVGGGVLKSVQVTLVST